MAKRKQDDNESLEEVQLHQHGRLEMLSEEENEDDDDGVVDDFPELNVQSDSETGYSTAEDDDDSESVNSLHLFPKPKKVVSDITNQPKLVYPEIEPDYDSDSSTEDVSSWIHFIKLVKRDLKGSKSHWKRACTLV